MDKRLPSKIHPDFHNLFIRNESKVLLGYKYVNFWILISMLSITFLAIGFSNGSLDYLKEKMKDPFVKSVKVVVPTFGADRISNVIYELNQDSLLMAEYRFKNLTGYYQYPLQFVKYNHPEDSYEYYGRSIDLANPLLDKISAGENLITGRTFLEEEDIGIIVTELFLEKLGYPEDELFINLSVDYYGEIKAFPMPVIAVVKDLPDNANFITTPYFYNLIQKDIKNEGPLDFDNTENLIIYTSDTVKAYDLKMAIENYLGSGSFESLGFFVSSPGVSYLSISKGYEILVNFREIDDDKIVLFDSVFNNLRSAAELSDFDFYQLYNIKTYSISDREDGYGAFDRVSVNFYELDKVREFRSFFLKLSELDIDMGQIESRDNYNLVTNLTRILSVVLIGFSVLSISLFLSNIFKRHLEKIKMNIGTFKAFGIDNKTLQFIYFKLVGYFILFAMLISFVLATAIGYFGFVRMLFSILAIKNESNGVYFQIFDIWTFISVTSILIVCFFVLYCIINRILVKTPGDLIYDR